MHKTLPSPPSPFVRTVGFFISPAGVISEVQGGSSVATVIRNPTNFGRTSEEIENTYRAHGEHLGTEGKARARILTRFIEKGWICVRRYPATGWSVTVIILAPGTVALLQDWAGRFLTGHKGCREADPYILVITATAGIVVSCTMKELAEGFVAAECAPPE